jgi:hypothetical protein
VGGGAVAVGGGGVLVDCGAAAGLQAVINRVTEHNRIKNRLFFMKTSQIKSRKTDRIKVLP